MVSVCRACKARLNSSKLTSSPCGSKIPEDDKEDRQGVGRAMKTKLWHFKMFCEDVFPCRPLQTPPLIRSWTFSPCISYTGQMVRMWSISLPWKSLGLSRARVPCLRNRKNNCPQWNFPSLLYLECVSSGTAHLSSMAVEEKSRRMWRWHGTISFLSCGTG